MLWWVLLALLYLLIVVPICVAWGRGVRMMGEDDDGRK